MITRWSRARSRQVSVRPLSFLTFDTATTPLELDDRLQHGVCGLSVRSREVEKILYGFGQPMNRLVHASGDSRILAGSLSHGPPLVHRFECGDLRR
jgi:hypothetical protein